MRREGGRGEGRKGATRPENVPAHGARERAQHAVPAADLVAHEGAAGHGAQRRLAEAALALATPTEAALAEAALAVLARRALALGRVGARGAAGVDACALADGAGGALEHARAGAAAAGGAGGGVVPLRRVALLVGVLAAAVLVVVGGHGSERWILARGR